MKRRDFQYLLSSGSKKKLACFTVYFNLASLQKEIVILTSKKLNPVKRNKIKRRLKNALNNIFKLNFSGQAVFFASEKILNCNYQKLLDDFNDLYKKLNNDQNIYPLVTKII